MVSRRKKAIDALLTALACGASAEVAARKAGVSERTVYRRLADPSFQQQLAALRADMVQRSAGMLTAASLEAVKTLVELLNPAQPPARMRRRQGNCCSDTTTPCALCSDGTRRNPSCRRD